MRKKAILAFMLAAALFLTGCALVEKDLVVDNATVIIELGDKTVSKAQVSYNLENQLYYQAYMYSMYGMSFDPSDPATRASALENVLEGLAEQLVKQQKVEEMGLDVFTEEEDAKIRETAQANMDSDKEGVKADYFADTTLEGEALDTAILDKMKELGLEFDTYYYVNAKNAAAQDKLRESVIKDVTVTEEEAKAQYDTKVEEAKATYTTSPSSYGSSVNSNSTVYYAPDGYRYVKHILRAFPTETKSALGDLQTKINEKAAQITSIDSSMTALGEGVAQDAPERVKLVDEKAAAEKEKADLQAQYDKALEDAYAALQPTVDEVLAKIAAGEEFDALMETYGEDPGMKNSPQKENGYAVSKDYTSFDPAFLEAAMALAAVNDVSPAVRGQSGIHIIKYVSEIPEGPVAFETVKGTITSEMLTENQDTAYTDQVSKWVAESGVKIYKERMNQ